MIELWFSSSPIQNVRGPAIASAWPRLAVYAELKIFAAGRPTNAAMRRSSSTWWRKVPSMKRTAPGPTPNSRVAASAAAISAGWFDSDR